MPLENFVPGWLVQRAIDDLVAEHRTCPLCGSDLTEDEKAAPARLVGISDGPAGPLPVMRRVCERCTSRTAAAD